MATRWPFEIYEENAALHEKKRADQSKLDAQCVKDMAAKRALKNAGLSRVKIKPLHASIWAAKTQKKCLASVNAMLEQGAAPDDKGDCGYTALMLCSMKGMSFSMDRLMALGAKIDERSDSGQTALMLAAVCDQAAAVNALISAGADASVVDEDGDSVVNRAISSGMGVIGAVIEAGADPMRANKRGLTPRTLVDERDPTAIDKIGGLEAHGEKFAIRQVLEQSCKSKGTADGGEQKAKPRDTRL